MLELKNIRKTYITANERVEALKGINLKFRESEFVSILGQSGCGKTTLLNIIGGLDRYTSGNLKINGKSTNKFKDKDWDAYRNYKIGFVFQSYNLIGHQTVLSNVELALTIGGISKKERKERAIKALEEVGLKEQIYKKPNQLSGGQMQRVAIARALVNNPDIILADEPTGALDTKTSVQIMEILKKISKNKLIIMVTHNPELAEKYSSRIIKILDGTIIEDSNPLNMVEDKTKIDNKKIGRTSMKFWTAFRLSLNNLLTKKGRTILVSFAGSIGIIGIALVQSISNGFQGYVDKIQEDTLTSYPLTIMQETSDIASVLLSMTSSNKEENINVDGVKEEQYISKVLDSLSTNDLRSFKKYLEENYSKVEKDLSSITYAYSVEPIIYGIDVTSEYVKLNPSNLFSSSFEGMSFMGSSSSTYSQMIDDRDLLNNSYDILAGKWPESYNEMIVVLPEKNTISDLLVYSLGFRNRQELTEVVTQIMSGETVTLNNEPMSLTYEDLMNKEFKLILPSEIYRYNEIYDVYEDMTEDKEYMKKIYNDAPTLKIVGVVTAKEGTSSMALNPGVAYTSKLKDYIIEQAAHSEIVKKQIANQEIDVFSGTRFDDKNKNVGFNFDDMMSIDTKKLQSAFNIKIDQKEIENQTSGYMEDINNSINTDISPARKDFKDNLNKFTNEILKEIPDNMKLEDIDIIVEKYLNSNEPSSIIQSLEQKYVIPKEVFKTTYSGILKALLNAYLGAASSMTNIPNESFNLNSENNQQSIPNKEEIQNTVVSTFMESVQINETIDIFARTMTEAVMKKTILTKVGELTSSITKSFATAFNIDQEKISSAFQMKMSEEELTRVISSMMNKKETTAKVNLISLGYQDKEEPTYIAFYFNSFEGKEDFIEFIESYNENVKENGEEDKEINYTDTTGILMSSVKTIVNAVTYVLIAFISISLVVSSIMIGIITYISVFERTKEIGILRAIGASKRNISSIFNAETFIIGLLSGLFGIGFTYAVIPGINSVLHHFTGNIPLNAILYFSNAISLVLLSIVLTLIGGLIPAKAASKKDPVIALRTE